MIALTIAALVLMPGTQAKSIQTEPGPGCLEILSKDHKALRVMPLEKTTVTADIAGFGARVTVKQIFKNDSKVPIEAIYTFPLPHDAAVDRMRMSIGPRVIEGLIKTRQEAQRIYNDAKNQGKTASLLEQERPNIFTQSVANIMPGQPIEIEISYVQWLKYEDGAFEFNYPMVVGPRYTRGEVDADKVTPPITPKGTRTGQNIDVTVNIDAGMTIEDVKSELHQVNVSRQGPNKARIELADKNEIPNRDLILRYRVAGKSVKSGVLAYADKHNGGFFTLMLMPPQAPDSDDIAPKEVIFVMDQSGSQRGFPIGKSKELTRKLIEALGPNDTFNVLGFNTGLNWLWPVPRPNTIENRMAAMDFVAGIDANGGTHLIEAVQGAYAPRPDPDRRRLVVFNTDGYVGNDFDVIQAVAQNRGSSRMFTFGVGNSVNRYLIDSMSYEGRGDSEIVTLESESAGAVERFLKRTRRPILIDVGVQFEGIDVVDVIPAHVPDVFSEKPVIVRGRYTRPGKGRIVLSGLYAGRETWSQVINVTMPDLPGGSFDLDQQVSIDPDVVPDVPVKPARGSAISTLWARGMVDEVQRRAWLDSVQGKAQNVEQQITRLGLAFGIMTQYTSFVAVEERVVNRDGKAVKVRVPVEMADGVSYEGIFGIADEKRRLASTTLGMPGGAGGFGGGGLSRGSTGAAPQASMPPAAGAMKSEIRFVSYDPSDNSLVVRADKLSESEMAAMKASWTPEQERTYLAKLKPPERERYLYFTRVDESLRAGKKETYAVNVYLKDAAKDIAKKLAEAGLRNVKVEEGKLAAGMIKRADLKKLAQVAGVHLVTERV